MWHAECRIIDGTEAERDEENQEEAHKKFKLTGRRKAVQITNCVKFYLHEEGGRVYSEDGNY